MHPRSLATRLRNTCARRGPRLEKRRRRDPVALDFGLHRIMDRATGHRRTSRRRAITSTLREAEQLACQ